jgi:hypothetical protein
MVRPVASAPDGRLGRMLDQSSASWYGGRRFQFLVCERDRFDRVDAATAARTFGNPVRTYSVDGYEVLVWPQAITVAPYPGVAPHP